MFDRISFALWYGGVQGYRVGLREIERSSDNVPSLGFGRINFSGFIGNIGQH